MDMVTQSELVQEGKIGHITGSDINGQQLPNACMCYASPIDPPDSDSKPKE